MEVGAIIGISIVLLIVVLLVLIFAIFMFYKTALVRKQVQKENLRALAQRNSVKDKDIAKVKKHAGIIANIKYKLKKRNEVEKIAEEIINK